MGREIVYCEGCGERILEAEFEKGHAVTILNKKYCAKCKGAHETPGNAGSSALLKSVGSPSAARARVAPATHRPASPGTDRKTLPPPKGSPVPLIIGGIVGATALGLLVWLMLADSKPRETLSIPAPDRAPKPSESPDRKIQEAMKKLEDLAAMAISTPEQIIAECARVRPLVLGTRHATRVDQIESLAVRTKNEKTRKENYESGMKEIHLLRAADPDFEKVDAVYKLIEDLKQVATNFTQEQKLEIEKEEIDLTNAFNKYAQEQGEALIGIADAYGKTGNVADAIKTLETYPVRLRKTAHWEAVDRRIRHYKTAPRPSPTAAPPPVVNKLPDVPAQDTPPVGKVFTLFDGKNLDNLHRAVLQKEKEDSWKIVDGVLQGESSFKVGEVQPSYYDPLFTKAEFANFELEFEAKLDQGIMSFFARFEHAKGTFASAAMLQAETTKDWSKFKARWTGGKYTIERVGNPPLEMKIVSDAAKGRFVFGMSPGTKVYLRGIKVTPLKD